MTRTITLPKQQGYGSSHIKGSWNSFPETIMLEIFNRYKQSNEKKFSFESFLYQVAQIPTTIHKRFHEELLSLVLDLPETNITPYKNMSLILNIYTTEELQKMLTHIYRQNAQM